MTSRCSRSRSGFSLRTGARAALDLETAATTTSFMPAAMKLIRVGGHSVYASLIRAARSYSAGLCWPSVDGRRDPGRNDGAGALVPPRPPAASAPVRWPRCGWAAQVSVDGESAASSAASAPCSTSVGTSRRRCRCRRSAERSDRRGHRCTQRSGRSFPTACMRGWSR